MKVCSFELQMKNGHLVLNKIMKMHELNLENVERLYNTKLKFAIDDCYQMGEFYSKEFY